MVGKLFKHECISYCRTAVPICSLLLIISIFGRILQMFENDTVVYDIISGITYGSFFIFCFASVFAVLVFGVVRFYKHLFTAEGYLTFTLPVTVNQHIFIKLITYLLFQTISFITIIISVGFMFRFEFLVEIVKAINYLLYQIPDMNFIHIVLYTLGILLLSLFSFSNTILLYYCCISIGQTAKKHRVGFSVGVYFIYTIIVQTISSVISVVAGVLLADYDITPIIEYIKNNLISFIHIVMWSLVLFSMLYSLIGFLIVRYILVKKLNLE